MTWEHRRALNRAEYSTTNRIFFRDITSCGHMNFFGGLWKAWIALCQHLLLDPVGFLLPVHRKIVDIVKSLQPFASLDLPTTIALLSTMGKLGALRVQDFWEITTLAKKDFGDKFSKIREVSPEILELAHQLIRVVQEADEPCRGGELEPDN